MKRFINQWQQQLADRPKLKQWLWFFALWFGGLGAVLLLAAFLKQVINAI